MGGKTDATTNGAYPMSLAVTGDDIEDTRRRLDARYAVQIERDKQMRVSLTRFKRDLRIGQMNNSRAAPVQPGIPFPQSCEGLC